MIDLLIVASLSWTVALILQARRLLFFFQLEEYNSRRFLRWVRPRLAQVIPLAAIVIWLLAGLASSLSIFYNLLPTTWLAAAKFGWGSVVAVFIGLELRRPTKKKLVYTLRLIRVLLVLSLVSVTLTVMNARWAVALSHFLNIEHGWALCLAILFFGLLMLGAPLWIVVADVLLFPLEKAIRRSYRWTAAGKLHRVHPLVVGITGSYGKTSTKEILAHLLNGQKRVLATPKSYNTLMGICKVINRSLRVDHEILVVEMGAYQLGEIAQICDLVPPSLGAITAIGPQHLERFGSMDHIARAKYELIEALPLNGVAVFNAEDAYTAQFVRQAHGKEVVLVSIEGNPLADLYATEIRSTSNGLTFSVVDRRSGERCPCAVRLFGRHSVSNILIAAALALELGMSLRIITERLKSMLPIQHRLQLLRRADGLNIIDDAYNSNPVGAQNALEALASFEGGRKVLVTPGLVELGSIEWDANYELGRQAAPICDFVILVGSDRVLPVHDGLRSGGFDSGRIEVVPTIQRASEILAKFAKINDTVLFLNDLPDTYSEIV